MTQAQAVDEIINGWLVGPTYQPPGGNEIGRSLPQIRSDIQGHKAGMNAWGVKRMVMYEGGMHLIANSAYTHDAELQAICHAVNRDPRMRTVVSTWLQYWHDNGGEAFCYFFLCGPLSDFGDWGALENIRASVPAVNSYKYAGIMDYLALYPTVWWPMPVLSDASVSSATTTSLTPVVTTTEPDGSIAFVVVAHGDFDALNNFQKIALIKAGQQANGSAAPATSSKSVSAAGEQTFSTVTGLTASAIYDVWFLHTTAIGNDSLPVGRIGVDLGNTEPVTTNLLEHFKKGSLITSLSGAVTDWTGSVAGSVISASGAGRPTLQANGTIYFDGDLNELRGTIPNMPQPCTVVLIAKPVSHVGSACFFDSSSIQNRQMAQHGLSPQVNLYAGGGFTSDNNSDFSLNAYNILFAEFDGALSTITVGRNPPTNCSAGSIGTGPGGTNTIVLGAEGIHNKNANFYVKDFLLYSGKLSSANKLRMAAYAETR